MINLYGKAEKLCAFYKLTTFLISSCCSSYQIYCVHRNPAAPRGNPYGQRHPGDAALAEEDDAHDVQQGRARPPHKGD